MADTTKAPTAETYDNFQFAYDFYNQALFGNSLPNCIITMQRKNRSFGYFAPNRWEDTEDRERTDEIALNPTHFDARPAIETLSTLVHEMVHLWQHHYGDKPPKSANHNKEWAEEMKRVGLMPSSTGEAGGKETGKKVSHYILPDGDFSEVSKTLINDHGWVLPYVSKDPETSKKKASAASKTKFSCPECQENCWGKPTLSVLCEECGVKMEPEVKE